VVVCVLHRLPVRILTYLRPLLYARALQATKAQAVSCFFETLVLATKGHVTVAQSRDGTVHEEIYLAPAVSGGWWVVGGGGWGSGASCKSARECIFSSSIVLHHHPRVLPQPSFAALLAGVP
jgi:hypothetical protein